VENRHAPKCARSSHASGNARTVDSSAVPKRLLLALVVLVAAVVAIALWDDGAPARSASRAAPARQQTAVADDAGSDAAVKPRPPAPLFGRVVEERAGNPVAGASVVAYAFEAGTTLKATSSADGSFGFPDAAGQVFDVVTRHPGFGAVSLRASPSDQPILVRLPAGGGLRGRVVSAPHGAAVSPCRVSAFRCRGESEPWDPHAALLQQLLPDDLVMETTVSTRSDGSFEMTGLRPGPYALLVAGEGFAPRSVGSWNSKERIEVRAGAATEVEVTLPATAALFIDVTDEETGEPLDDARFEAVIGAERWSTSVPVPAIGSDGAYELRVGYGVHRIEDTGLRISRDGYAPRTMRFSGQQAGYRFTIALGRGGAILGHVWGSGKPAQGSIVLVENVGSGSVVASAIADPLGAFDIGPLAAGEELAVHAYDRALDPIAVVTLTLENGEERVLEIGGRTTAVEGRVLVGGVPAASASVRVSGASDSGSAATGKDGRYCVEGLSAGRHEVEVFADDADFQRFVDLKEGQRLRLDIDASVAITGVVVDAGTGGPIADAAELQLEVSAERTGTPGSNSADVEADGRFRLYVEPGAYELGVPESEDLYVTERPPVEATEGGEYGPVTLRVLRDPKDGRIDLDIKDAATGETVADGDYKHSCKLTRGWGSFEHGVIEEEALSLGTHRFRVWSEAHAPRRVEITLSLDRRTVRQTVALPPGEAVRIAEIRRGNAGWVAGLRVGDLIIACNGKPTTSIAALDAALDAASGEVAIEFERAGERRTATLARNSIGAELENILLGR